MEYNRDILDKLYPLLREKLWTPEKRNQLFKALAAEDFWKQLSEPERDKMSTLVKERIPRFTKKQRPRIQLMIQKYPAPDESDKNAILGSVRQPISGSLNYHSDLHGLHPLRNPDSLRNPDPHWQNPNYYPDFPPRDYSLEETFGHHYPRDSGYREKENRSVRVDYNTVCQFQRPKRHQYFSSLPGGHFDPEPRGPPSYQSSGFWRRRNTMERNYSDSIPTGDLSETLSRRTSASRERDEEESAKGDPALYSDKKKKKNKLKKKIKGSSHHFDFNISEHLDRVHQYMMGESEPVPLAQMESMFPLPNSCKERSLVKLLTRSDRFRALTNNNVVCITLEQNVNSIIPNGESKEDEGKKDAQARALALAQPSGPARTVHWLSNSRFEIERWQRGCPLFDHKARQTDMHFLPECARIANLQPSMSEQGDCIYLNIHEPFCGVMVGVQGAGKSHTTNCIIENCMISNPPVTKIKQPLSTLVFHYDQNEDIACEAASLTTIGSKSDPNPNSVLGNLVVLVSPGNFAKRYNKYRELPNCKVFPLLLGFSRLGVVQLKQLMNVAKDEHQLYMQVVMAVLRRRQKAGWPAQSFEEFRDACIEQRFLKQQSNPLRQRLQLLESFLYDTEENESLRQEALYNDITQYFGPGTMVICDLTDPLIDPQGANCMFQVILSLFIEKRMKCGKLVVFDEAHKYLDRSVGNLCDDVTHLVRQMRHYGVRVLVSTQNPMVLPHELLELCSFAILHRFFSRVWFDHLRSRLNLSAETLQECCNLRTGEAVVYCSQAKILQPAPISVIGPKTYRCLIRERMTRDNGITIVNELT